MALTERYLTAEATGTGHAGTLADPWSLADLYASATTDMRVWVKSGTYTFTGTGQNYITSSFGSATNTVGKPLILHGYYQTPGDLDSGVVGTNYPLFTISQSAAYISVGQYASNVWLNCLKFEGSTTYNGGLLYLNSPTRLWRCWIKNTNSSTTNPGQALNCIGSPCYIIESYVENSVRSAFNNSTCLSGTSSVAHYLGCTIKTTGKVKALQQNDSFDSCIFIGNTPYTGAAAFTTNTDAPGPICNCTFYGFPVGYKVDGNKAGSCFNNIFYYCTTCLSITGTTRDDGLFAANRSYGHTTLYEGFGDDINSPVGLIDALSSDPFKSGTYQLSNNEGAGQCIYKALPIKDISGVHFLLDIGAFQREIVEDYPDAVDVRYQTSYANGTQTGSLRVPDPAYVKRGVLTDATTGTFDARRSIVFEDKSNAND